MTERQEPTNRTLAEEVTGGVGKNILRQYTRSWSIMACCLMTIVVVWREAAAFNAQRSVPTAAVLDKEGNLTFSDLDDASKSILLYQRTVERFAGTLLTMHQRQNPPEKEFAMLCTPEVAKKAMKNWRTLQDGMRSQYQNLVPIANVEFIKDLGERNNVGTFKIHGYLIGFDVSKDTPMQVDEVEMSLKVTYNPRLHLRHLAPFFVTGFDYKSEPRN